MTFHETESTHLATKIKHQFRWQWTLFHMPEYEK